MKSSPSSSQFALDSQVSATPSLGQCCRLYINGEGVIPQTLELLHLHLVQ